MVKFFLLTVLAAPLVIPMFTARKRSARKGMRQTVVLVLAFNVFFVVALLLMRGH